MLLLHLETEDQILGNKTKIQHPLSPLNKVHGVFVWKGVVSQADKTGRTLLAAVVSKGEGWLELCGVFQLHTSGITCRKATDSPKSNGSLWSQNEALCEE